MLIADAWDYILDVARERLAANFSRASSHRLGDHVEVLGVAGELAARRFLGLPERELALFDSGWDLAIGSTDAEGKPKQWTIDVKTRPWVPDFRFLPLQWPLHKPVRADLALLVFVHLVERRAAVVSFADREEIMAAKIDYGGSLPCRVLYQPQMHSATRLYNLLVTGEDWCSEDALLDPVQLGLA